MSQFQISQSKADSGPSQHTQAESERVIEARDKAHDDAMRMMQVNDAESWYNRGLAEATRERNAEAAESFDRALMLRPQYPEAFLGKAVVSIELRRFDVAESTLAAALSILPDNPKLLALRGQLHLDLKRFAQAEADFDAALALDPRLVLALWGKAQLSLLAGKTGQAMATSKALLAQDPSSDVAMSLLGICMAQQGDAAGAIALFNAALANKPDNAYAISNKIFSLDFLPEADFAVQQAARRQWWDVVGAKLGRVALVPRDLDPEKRLTIGYVSSDFSEHSAAHTFMPVLRCHDHAKFRIVGYSCSPTQDDFTASLRTMTDEWVEAWRFSDNDLAARIQADSVDILVDLSGHSLGHRLGVFARKPAPIQVTAWGNATGTGLPTIDYLFADKVAIPPAARSFFAEKIHDLPSLITIEPLADIRPAQPPMLRNGYVTFGVFNRISKISDGALRLWSALISAVPRSKIIIKHGALDDAVARDGLIARFVAHGIARSDVTCLGATTRKEHLAAFEKVDISLDPFPQNGGVSTWESLYAGVPVVTKLGNGAASRAGGAVVKAIGLDDWVANDAAGYLAIATGFAAKPSHLKKLRAELPRMIRRSAAGNVRVYTARVEDAYRGFWRDYCASDRKNTDA